MMLEDSRTSVTLLLQEQEMLRNQAGILVNPLIQRWAIQTMGRNFLGMNLGVRLVSRRCYGDPEIADQSSASRSPAYESKDFNPSSSELSSSRYISTFLF
jgi:hypothetical protein